MSSAPAAPSVPTRGVAVVGAGKMGLQHARVIRSLDVGLPLKALVDPSAEARAAAREAHPELPCFASLAEAEAETEFDVVHVCTPPRTHFAVAEEALERGCHVFVEKPFVATEGEARALLELASARGVSLCAGHQLLHEPAYRKLADQVALLGEVVHVESYFAFVPSRGTATGRPGLRPDDQLMDILPHPLYLLLDVLERAAPDGETVVEDVHLGRGATLHALVRRGPVTGNLTVTLSGRPVASTVRVVGSGGEVEADLVRGIVLEQLGPGAGAIDKVLAPFLLAAQGVFRTTRALLARVLGRTIRYPSLTELVSRWYRSLREPDAPAPMTAEQIRAVVAAFETLVERTGLGGPPAPAGVDEDRPLVVVTGGTGWLGTEVTRRLVERGARVTVVSRRLPGSWEQRPHVRFLAADLAEGIDLSEASDAVAVVHCAAETSGGAEAHERNSIAATRNLVSAMADAGIRPLIHVSSVAVLSPAAGPVSESSPLEPDPEACGPYVWGKLLSERLVRESEAVDAHIVRPAAIVDSRAFVPPGKLGKRVGPLFVAVGGKKEVLGVVELEWVARAIAWMALNVDEAPESINLLDPELPTRGELIRRVKRANPTLWTLRLPRPVLSFLGLVGLGASRILRPGKAPIDLRKVFARQAFDTAASQALAARLREDERPGAPPEDGEPSADAGGAWGPEATRDGLAGTGASPGG